MTTSRRTDAEGRATPWFAGRFRRGRAPQLLFGRMHEDWRIEEEVFPRGGRVFAIASAGDTALALAASGHFVTAVDVNPVQAAYVEQRLRGDRPRAGRADRLLDIGRRMLRAVGWSTERLEKFLRLEDVERQVAVWRELAGPGFRAVLRLILSRPALRMAYDAAFVESLPADFAAVVGQRLERGFAAHPNSSNEHAWRLLLGREPPAGEPPVPLDVANRVRVACMDAASWLESSAACSYDAFALSNILDGAGESYRRRLLAAVARAATERGIAVLRSFAEPQTEAEGNWAVRDRSLLWGRISITSARAMHDR